MSSTETIVWNRACHGGGEQARTGDQHLAALLHFHGAAMNGGVFHAAQFCTKVQLRKALAGFTYFELLEAAALIAEAELVLGGRQDPGEYEQEFNARYYKVARDSQLSAKFSEKYASVPEDFAPIQ